MANSTFMIELRTERLRLRTFRDSDALVHRVGELDARRPGHDARDAARGEVAHVGAPRDAGDRCVLAGLC